MKHIIFTFYLSALIFSNITGQEDTTLLIPEIAITQDRIYLPYSSQDRQVQIISKKQIQSLPAQTLPEILQYAGAIDIKRRGVNGVQSDVSIRGGSFEQVLILLNGVRMNDAQTGHHSMYLPIEPDQIERIEIVRGGAARIYGQNAYSGVLNIITKPIENTQLGGQIQYGSFNTLAASLNLGLKHKNTSQSLSASWQQSDGYRYNTDYKIFNAFYQSKFNVLSQKIDFFGGFTERKFGANGFYANEKFADQYEEVQTSIVGLTTKYTWNDKWSFKPVLSWRRNQDMYVFIRSNPSFFRNLHIGNTLNGALHAAHENNWGKLGLGAEISSQYLRSNNLGDQQRNIYGIFVDQNFNISNERWSVTSGTYIQYIDQIKKWQVYPGLDVGYNINNSAKLFLNAGISNRVPSYTDLYYKSRTELGNPNLLPEQSWDAQAGIRYNKGRLRNEVTLFYRQSNNTIEWLKDSLAQEKWLATNLTQINTAGLEIRSDYDFNTHLAVGFRYSYIDQDAKALNNGIGRYSLDHMTHQVLGSMSYKLLNNKLTFGIYGRYNVRAVPAALIDQFGNGRFFILDLRADYNIKSFSFSFIANNVTNTVYRETSLVPMPGTWFNTTLAYKWMK